MDRKAEDHNPHDNNDAARVDAYIDGELTGADHEQFEREMRSDTALRQRVDSEREISGAVRRAVQPEPAPEALRSRITDLIRATPWDEEEQAGATPETASRQAAPPETAPRQAPSREAASREAPSRPAASRPAASRPAASRQAGPRRLLPRIAAVAAAVALLVTGFQLMRGGPGDGAQWPWLIEESVRLFDEALVAPVAAAEPGDVPTIDSLEFVRVYCKGKGRDGKLNPCFLYRTEKGGGTIGYFCLDDRLADDDFVRYGNRSAKIGDYAVVASGPPEAMHLWVAEGIEPDELQRIIREKAGDRGANGHAEFSVKDMKCSNCADRIITAIEKMGTGVARAWCDVANKRVFVLFTEDVSDNPHHEALIAAIAAIDDAGYSVEQAEEAAGRRGATDQRAADGQAADGQAPDPQAEPGKATATQAE